MGAGHKGLGGDTAVVDAGAADELAFDDRHGLPGSVNLPASGGPACPAPTMIASNFCCHEGGSDEADEERDKEPTANGDDVLDQRTRPVLAIVARRQPLPGPAPPIVPSTAPMMPAPVR